LSRAPLLVSVPASNFLAWRDNAPAVVNVPLSARVTTLFNAPAVVNAPDSALVVLLERLACAAYQSACAGQCPRKRLDHQVRRY
jgi:hypothetical protein